MGKQEITVNSRKIPPGSSGKITIYPNGGKLRYISPPVRWII